MFWNALQRFIVFFHCKINCMYWKSLKRITLQFIHFANCNHFIPSPQDFCEPSLGAIVTLLWHRLALWPPHPWSTWRSSRCLITTLLSSAGAWPPSHKSTQVQNTIYPHRRRPRRSVCIPSGHCPRPSKSKTPRLHPGTSWPTAPSPHPAMSPPSNPTRPTWRRPQSLVPPSSLSTRSPRKASHQSGAVPPTPAAAPRAP